jgi:EmrB/QacA subfamily drug resistance transporter
MTTPPSDHSLPALRARYGERRYRWLLLLSVMVGTMAAIMSSTIINVAIPDMSHHFALGQERAQWVTSGFMAAMTVSMLTTPWLLARYGYRRTYVGCMWLLMAGGVAGGVANDYPLVLAARVAEGLAAGVVQPIPAIIILRAFQPHEQGRASGIFGMGVVLAPALGPSIGGLLVDGFGWRSIFFMVVPFCIASLWLAHRFVPTSSPGGEAAKQGAGLDWRGLLLAAVGTLCLLNGLVELHGGTTTTASLLLGGAALTLVAFVVLQGRTLKARLRHPDEGVDPLINLSLFQDRRFAMGSIVAFIYGIALFGSTYLLPVYMQSGLGLSASYVGTILLPAGLVLAVTIAWVGRLADRQPTHRLVSIGLVLLAASFALMVTIDPGRPAQLIPLLVVWAILGRVGLGFILPSLNIGAMRGLERTHIPQGASVINFLRMLGGAAGVSLCGIVLEWRLAAHGVQLATSGATTPARVAAFEETFLMLAAICALALTAALKLKDAPARHDSK